MTFPDFLGRLEGVKEVRAGQAIALCTAHPDNTPSLSIREAGTKILLHCWAGCEPSHIMGALGLTLADLFTDNPISRGQRPTPHPQQLDLSATSHRFDMAALDRRLRADAVLAAASNFTIDSLNEQQLDRALDAVASAYRDRERAAFLETVADNLRVKAFLEKEKRNVA